MITDCLPMYLNHVDLVMGSPMIDASMEEFCVLVPILEPREFGSLLKEKGILLLGFYHTLCTGLLSCGSVSI